MRPAYIIADVTIDAVVDVTIDAVADITIDVAADVTIDADADVIVLRSCVLRHTALPSCVLLS
jgi:hypothetical protein